MTWLIYENSDENTQVFIGLLLILSISIVIVANVFFWIKNKIKNKKNGIH